VLGFLNVAGRWDPRLAFVLGGAVGVSALGYRLSRRVVKPAFAARFDIPANRRIDFRLLAVAGLLVGFGTRLGGFCPGPAMASLSLGLRKSVVFVIAMLLGMALHRMLGRPSPATVARADLPAGMR
jgi:uncharacterized membrane protein YedE/YeeE